MGYSFERLEVWQRARGFTKKVYEVTAKYPKREEFGLVQHTRKSAVSVLSSIAEGSSRYSRNDFRRYIQISLGSLYEVVSQLFIALDNNYLLGDVFNELYAESEVIAKMLSKLSSSKP